MKKIKIKYFKDETGDPIVKEIAKIKKGDWIDLRSAMNVMLKAGESFRLPLGVAMKLPKRYEAYMAPRGSTFNNFGVFLTNQWGIIDESFNGDDDQWHCLIYALDDCSINVNDRICQFRIQRIMPSVKFKTVNKLGDTNRGWLGSTGKN